jgi:hypothetical protein
MPHAFLSSAQSGDEFPVSRTKSLYFVEKEPPKPFVQEAGWAVERRSALGGEEKICARDCRCPRVCVYF